MTADDIRRLLAGVPFEPFTLCVADGGKFYVTKPDQVVFQPGDQVIDWQHGGYRQWFVLAHVSGINFDPKPNWRGALDLLSLRPAGPHTFAQNISDWWVSLNRLTSFVPPPAKPAFADGDWTVAEAEFGPLPAEWKAFIRAYGSGMFFDSSDFTELYVTNPLDPFGPERIREDLGVLQAEYGKRPELTVHPTRPGYLPWGGDSDGSVFSFWTAGDPDGWVTAGNIDGVHRRLDCGMVTFLLGTLARVGPSRWYDAVFAERTARPLFRDFKCVRFYPADQTGRLVRNTTDFPDS